MWHCLVVTVVIFQATTSLPQYDLANKDVYEIREDKDSNTVQFVNPRPAEPVLREITYYHLIERAINGTVQTNKIVGSIEDHERDSERPTTNAHGQGFEIDMLHPDSQIDDQIVQHHDEIIGYDRNSGHSVANNDQPWQDTDKRQDLLEQLNQNWYLQHLLGSTEKPSQILDQPLVQTQAPVEHPEVVTPAPDPVTTQTFGQTQPSLVQTKDWFHPNRFVQQEEIVQPEVSKDVKEKEAEHGPEVSEYSRTENPTGNNEPVDPQPAEEIVEPQDSAGKVEDPFLTVPVEEKPEEDPSVTDRQNWYVQPSNPIVQPEVSTDSAVENIQVPADILSTETPETVVEGIVQENPAVVHEEPSESLAVENANTESPQGEVLATELDAKEDVVADKTLPDIFESTSESVIPGSDPHPEEVVSNPEFVETKGEVEVIEDPILTDAIIESESANPEEPTGIEEAVGKEVTPVEGEVVPETETAAEAVEDTQAQMHLLEPSAAEAIVKQKNIRRKRSPMAFEENPDFIPEAPMLPPLNYDSLPDYIRTAISTEAPHDEEAEVKDEVKIEAKMEEVKPDVIKLVQEKTGLEEKEVKEGLEKAEGVVNLDSKKARTYGMHLEGDRGYVWNDMFSSPGVSYKVGEESKVEEQKEEHVPATQPAVEAHPEVEHFGDVAPEKPEGHVEGLQPNHEGGTPVAEDMDDIFVNIDKEKNKQPPHYLVKPEPVAIDEHKEEASKDSENSTAIDALLKNNKFWSWISDWASSYIDQFLEKFTKVMREEMSKIPSARVEEKPQISTNSDNTEAGHTKEIPKEENKKEDEVRTIFVNGREISLTRSSNLEGELDDISEDLLKRRHDKKKEDDNSKEKEQIKVVSQAIYGNTLGNEKVTNIFIFFPENGKNKLMETVKPLLSTKDEVKPEENKEISIGENASSISEGSDITKPEEPKPTDNVKPDVAKKPENVESTDANAETIEASKVEIEPTTEAITKEDALEPNSEAESVNSESPVAKPELIDSQKEVIQPSTESVAENVNTDKVDEGTTETSTQPDLQLSSMPVEEVKTEAPLNQETAAPTLSVTDEPKKSDPLLPELNTESNVDKIDEIKTETSTQTNLETSSNPIQEESKTEAPITSDLNQDTAAPTLSVTEEPKPSDAIPPETNSESTTAPEVVTKAEGSLEKVGEQSEVTTESTESSKISESKVEVSSTAPVEPPVKEEKSESSTELPTSESEVKVAEDISTTLAPVDSEIKENAEVAVSTPAPEIDESTKKVDKVEPVPEVTPSGKAPDSEVKENAEVSVTSTSAPEEKPAEVTAST